MCRKILEKTKNDQRRIIKAKKLQKIANFIEKDNTEVFIKINKKNDKLENDKAGLKGRFGKKEGNNKSFSYISIVDLKNCVKGIAFMNNIEGQKAKFANAHADNVNGFISKFYIRKEDIPNEAQKSEKRLLNKFITEDIQNGEATHEVYKVFNDYMELLKIHIKEKEKSLEIKNEKEINQFTNKIEEHIMRKIYKYVYPEEPLKEDYNFYKRTKILEWIRPENLEIKKLFINQLSLAILYIKKMDEEKSVLEKIRCIQNSFTNINNLIKFSGGKDKDAGQDETTPIFQYVVYELIQKECIPILIIFIVFLI